MRLIDYTTNSPQEHLALDELLLIKAESGEIGETMRFWGSSGYFVVLGRSGKVEEECFAGKCGESGVPILRRLSGGGTVLQGPGCLNYSLILSYDADPGYSDIKTSYSAVLGKICKELQKAGQAAEIKPLSDLAVNGKKISGNAQARKKKYFLHHGTFLHGLDIDKVNVYLKYPPKEPEYRRGREHSDFISNIDLTSEDLKECVKRAFPAAGTPIDLSKEDRARLEKLAAEKYSSDEWNRAF